MKKFDEDCKALKQRLIEMGDVAQSVIRQAVDALIQRETKHIKEVKAAEKVLDLQQVDIDDEAIRLITIYAPVASDLRFLLMTSRIASELERVGDLARNMGKYVKLLVSQPELKALEDLPNLADLVCLMLRNSLDAYDRGDAVQATKTIKMDNQADEMDTRIFKDLLSYIGKDPNLTRTVALVLLSRSLERIGDHATNICEEVVYLVEAKDIRHKPT